MFEKSYLNNHNSDMMQTCNNKPMNWTFLHRNNLNSSNKVVSYLTFKLVFLKT